jgi:DMSO reductase anchor subunit
MHPALPVHGHLGAGWHAGSESARRRMADDRWRVAAERAAAIIFGLLSSTKHLGHPERAWRALSQWRSSWLSREGVASLITFIPAGIFALGWIFGADLSRGVGFFGVLTAVWAGITVYCTAMIYATLKPIAAWNNGYVVPCYLLLGLATGASWLAALLFASSAASGHRRSWR